MASPSYGIDVVALAFAVVLAAVLALLLFSTSWFEDPEAPAVKREAERGLGQLILERDRWPCPFLPIGF